ncbi:unnamed protein product [marine sediment metagenome]|uniref:Uncharacterized protein n=1 Tax=marine sediment metagenome TaxID=412755 RepID=X1E5D5_9ZZZZ
MDTSQFDDTNFISKPDIKSILSSDLRNCFDEEIVDRNTEFPKYLTEANNIIKSLKNIKEYRQFEDPKIEELRWFNFAHINKKK